MPCLIPLDNEGRDHPSVDQGGGRVELVTGMSRVIIKEEECWSPGVQGEELAVEKGLMMEPRAWTRLNYPAAWSTVTSSCFVK